MGDPYARFLTSHVVVADERGRFAQIETVRFDRSALVRGHAAACELVAAEWQSGNLNPLEPSGRYLVARRIAYADGELFADDVRIVRRMRDWFTVTERDASLADWLAEPRTTRWRDQSAVPSEPDDGLSAALE
jgi:hypothetical protein